MKESLFANVEGKQVKAKQDNFYDEVLEKRTRPELPNEGEKILGGVQEKEEVLFVLYSMRSQIMAV